MRLHWMTFKLPYLMETQCPTTIQLFKSVNNEVFFWYFWQIINKFPPLKMLRHLWMTHSWKCWYFEKIFALLKLLLFNLAFKFWVPLTISLRCTLANEGPHYCSGLPFWSCCVDSPVKGTARDKDVYYTVGIWHMYNTTMDQ